MLEKLPINIIIEVARYLNFHSRLNVASTCHHLKRILYNSILFEDIVIPPTHTTQVLLQFQKGRGRFVKYCSLDHRYVSRELLLNLPIIFPNLERLSYSDNLFLLPHACSDNLRIMKLLRKKLETSKTWVALSILSLLSANRFYNLRELDLDLSRIQNDLTTVVQPNEIHTLFRSTPILESLIFSFPKVTEKLLESLHDTNKKLKYLCIYNTTLEFKTETRQLDLLPATTLKGLKIVGNGNFQYDNCLVLDYMVRKYPNLKSLDLFMSNHDPSDGVRKPRDIRLLYHLKRLISRLEELKLNFYIMEDFIFSSDATEEHACHLKGMGFHMPQKRPLNMFYFPEGLLRLQKFTNITSLMLPIQKKSYVYYEGIELPYVKFLYLYDDTTGTTCHSFINIDELFFTYSRLENLKINSQCSIIGLGEMIHKQFCYPSLCSIEFRVLHMQLPVIGFLRDCLPNLKFFDLVSRIKYRVFKFNLPKHTLHSVNLNLFDNKNPLANWKIPLEIKEMDRDLVRINYVHHERDVVKVTEKEDQYREFDLQGNIVVVCKRILELKYNNHIIF